MSDSNLFIPVLRCAAAHTGIYTLSLHDALPIYLIQHAGGDRRAAADVGGIDGDDRQDRKSTRLNSSHVAISYAVFCLKKKSTLLVHWTVETTWTLTMAGENEQPWMMTVETGPPG